MTYFSCADFVLNLLLLLFTKLKKKKEKGGPPSRSIRARKLNPAADSDLNQ